MITPNEWADKVAAVADLVRSGLPIPEAVGLGDGDTIAVVIQTGDNTKADTIAWCESVGLPLPEWMVEWYAPDYEQATWPDHPSPDQAIVSIVAAAPAHCPDREHHESCDAEDCHHTICPVPCVGRVENACEHGKVLCLQHTGRCEQCAKEALDG